MTDRTDPKVLAESRESIKHCYERDVVSIQVSAFRSLISDSERLGEVIEERDQWKERAMRAEAEAMTLRDIERDRYRKKNPQDGDEE